MTSTTRTAYTPQGRRRATRCGSAGGVTRPASVTRVVSRGVAVSCDTGGSSRSGDLDLFAEAVPDALVELDELGRQPDLLDPARPGQVHADDVLDRRGTGGHDDDAVGEADRLGQVVGDEHAGGAAARPQAEELVLHQLTGLHV